MPRKRHPVIAPPQSPQEWLEEISLAYLDGRDVISADPVVGAGIREGDLFHTAPSVCLKFRGIKVSKTALAKATDAALASYVVNQEREPGIFAKPHLAFAFCYLAAHHGLDLVGADEVAATMDFVVEHEARFSRLLRRGAPSRQTRITPALPTAPEPDLTEKHRLAEAVLQARAALDLALGGRRRWPRAAFQELFDAVVAYAQATAGDERVHRTVAGSVSGLREFLEVACPRIPGEALARADRLETILFDGYDPHFDGDEPPGL